MITMRYDDLIPRRPAGSTRIDTAGRYPQLRHRGDRRPAAMLAPEVRTYPALQIRETGLSESGKWLEGRAVPYGEWTDVGWFMEQFTRGAFNRSIERAAAGLPLLLWHDNRTFPIGVSHQWRDNPGGLDAVWRIDDQDPLAVEGARKAAAGMLTGLSVGFSPIPERDVVELDDQGLPWITRTEARLLEVSLVPTPAYAGAQVSLVRSGQARRLGQDGPASAGRTSARR